MIRFLVRTLIAVAANAVGLIVAAVVLAVVLTVFALLGFGDDPGIGS